MLNASWHRLGWPSLDFLSGQSFDLTHSPHPLILPCRSGRKIVTIHDLFFYRRPDLTGAEIRRDYAPLVKAHARRADAVLTVSQATATDIETLLGVPRDRITVVPNGFAPEAFVPDPAQAEIVGRRYDLPSHYVLAVATLEPRKNLVRLVEAFGQVVERGWRGSLLLAGGSGIDEPALDAAIEKSRQDVELDPLSVSAAHILGIRLFHSGRLEEARVVHERVLELDPQRGIAHITMGSIVRRESRHRTDEIVALVGRGLDLAGRLPFAMVVAASVYAGAGLTTQANTMLSELRIRRDRGDYVSPFSFAGAYSAMGLNDEAFVWLDVALQERDTLLYQILNDDRFGNLRSDPRYWKVVDTMGLTPYAERAGYSVAEEAE
jgi:glycosyltransferase involved in cell wall biosynthesis